MLGVIADSYVATAASAYAAAVAADSPLVYWRLGETSGTTAVDASGNGRDGTYTNSPTLNTTSLLTAELTNKAMGVTSNNGTCASLATSTWADVTSVTVDCLANLSSAFDSSNGDAIVSRYTSGGFNWLLWRNTGGAWAVQARNTSGTAYNVAAADTVQLNTTYHLAFTWGGGFLTLYVNGVQVGQTAVVGNLQTGTAPIEAGRYSQTNGTTPSGTIDEVAVYGTALTATRIAAHAAAASWVTDMWDTSGSWSVPTGVTDAYVRAIGAGGGGMYSSSSSTGRGGGGGGAEALSYVTGLTPGGSVAIVRGTGGAGGIASTTAGQNGTASTFASTTVVAAGGTGATSTSGQNGGTTAASTGSSKTAGGNGGSGTTGGVSGAGGAAAGPYGGAGGPTVTGNGLPGVAGTAPGGGGSGAATNPAANGGPGANGRVYVTYRLP